MNPRNIEECGRALVFDTFADVVKTMASGRRLELVELLAQGEYAVEALARVAGMAVTTTSTNLQILRQAGLVATRRERTTIYYRLAGDDVAELYLAAKRVGLRRDPRLRDAVGAYLGAADGGECGPSIDPAAITADMTVIDVRPRTEFDAGHLPGALSIPMTELEQRHSEIPPGAEVVVYCRGELCRLARESAAWLRGHGVDARAMGEGVIEWRVTKQVSLDVV